MYIWHIGNIWSKLEEDRKVLYKLLLTRAKNLKTLIVKFLLFQVFRNNVMPANAAAWYMAKRRFFTKSPGSNQSPLLLSLLKEYPKVIYWRTLTTVRVRLSKLLVSFSFSTFWNNVGQFGCLRKLVFGKNCRYILKMVFCYQTCSDLLWEKIVLVVEKIFWNSRLKAENL